MPTSIELRQERARVVESMRAITERAETANRNLDAEELGQYDAHEKDFRSYGERIQRIEAQELRDAELATSVGADADKGGGTDGDAEKRSKDRRAAFMSFVRRGKNGMPPEQRALVENAAGDILVPEDLESEIYRGLPKIAVMRPLAGKRSTIRDRVRRRSLDEVSVGWGKLETNDQNLTDSMPGTPGEEWSWVEDQYGLAKVGEDEFDDTDVDLEAFIRDSFTRAVAESEDTAFTVGTGHTNHQPVGWATAAAGIPAIVGSGALADYTNQVKSTMLDNLKALIYAVPAQYRNNGSFIIPSATELHISLLKDANGQYYWQQSVQAGRPNTFLGYAVHNQEDVATVAASKIIAGFGDWSVGYRILDRQGMTVQRLVELYAEDGMIGFKIRRRVGGDVPRPQALRTLKTPAA
ncbi:MAG: phage major capsid protein [Jatrophihabitantaceae bacterium]